MNAQPMPRLGRVYLVGAGPGDPDLLTVKALRLLQTVDVVVHDRLVGPGVLALIPPGVERVFAGKQRAHHHLRQPVLNDLLVERARAGQTVVRLKGGDPFVFGRGGEELEALLHAGVPFEIVPGITAALGAAAYVGVPLTHRDHSHALVLATGYGQDGPALHDWNALARAGQTLCLYMGLSGLARMRQELIAAGMAPTTPACAVENATLPQQRVVKATLRELPERASRLDPTSPVLVIIGDVVALQDRYAWFTTAGASTASPFAGAAPKAPAAVNKRTA
ncbi:MAG: uroporphyrinogen-III C-methyltransferase [Geminicoccaceae bacterium]|nr:MAG: uroporphyrinogen-III C-methyltransferase [Geminicoccaceae bacterium]